MQGSPDYISVKKAVKGLGSFKLFVKSLSVAQGEAVSIIGESGSGKSTLLHLIGGFLRPDSGRVTIRDQAAHEHFGRRRTIRTLFQDLALFPHLTVRKQLALSLQAVGGNGDPDGQVVQNMIRHLSLVKREDHLPSQLSGGERHRLALGRALIAQPEVLLFDEPMTGLDLGNRLALWGHVDAHIRRKATTVIMVTHDPDIALGRSDKIVVVERGTCTRVGRPRELYGDPQSVLVANLLGGANVITIDGTLFQVEPSKIHLSSDPLDHLDYSFKGQLMHTDFRGTHLEFHVFVDGQGIRVRRPAEDSLAKLAAKAVIFGGGVVHLGWDSESIKNLSAESTDAETDSEL